MIDKLQNVMIGQPFYVYIISSKSQNYSPNRMVFHFVFTKIILRTHFGLQLTFWKPLLLTISLLLRHKNSSLYKHYIYTNRFVFKVKKYDFISVVEIMNGKLSTVV